MGVAYTPGLRVTAEAAIRRVRRLPLKGQVLVAAGQTVAAETVVARAEMPGILHTVRAAQSLHIEPQELAPALVKQPGEQVQAGDLIAETKGLLGLFRSQLRSPVSGTMEEVSAVSGHVRIRERPRVVELPAYIAGTVAEVIEGEGAVIEARGALVQGIFGVGGERWGRLRLVAKSPDETLSAEALGECAGCVLVGGAGADGRAIGAAAEAGATGLVVGAVSDGALREYLGYDIGVAITGQEQVPMTLILTEGFGELAMARRTWELLASLDGQLASINGATQIRAGVIRPEIVVTRDGRPAGEAVSEPEQVLVVGSRVRLIREPHFGQLGRVTALPVEPTEIETESKVRVAMVELDGGGEVRVPRANAEIVQE
ncbi:MAG: hypothetical protein ACE149_07640 [Armatimonadota bacterium]